jgi:hypothetical protein
LLVNDKGDPQGPPCVGNNLDLQSLNYLAGSAGAAGAAGASAGLSAGLSAAGGVASSVAGFVAGGGVAGFVFFCSQPANVSEHRLSSTRQRESFFIGEPLSGKQQ